MTRSKKSHAATASAKLASGNKKTFTNASSSAEKVVHLSNNTMKEIWGNSAEEAQKAQEKIFSISREGAENLVKSADSATKAVYESVAASRDNIESCIECGNITAAMAKDFSSELFEAANKSFSDGVEMTKDFFACRTLNDMLELNNRIYSQMTDTFFSRSNKISNMVFEYTNQAIEPINERISQASEHMYKALSQGQK
jgi:hypothetical protein